MEYIKKYKNVLMIAGVLILAAVAFFYWNSGNVDVVDETALVYTSGPETEASIIGQEILGALNELRRLKIDGSIFESAVFRSLVDHTISTTTESIGRTDPFAPLPGKIINEAVKR